jgi:molybdenum cofactor synthesis domain-containing protein
MRTSGQDTLRAAVISTGSEFFVGEPETNQGPVDLRQARNGPEDLNGPMITSRLATLGVDVVHQVIKPDDAELLEREFHHVLKLGVDVVVISGGMGPTRDDKTNQIISTVTGRPRELVRPLWPLVMDRQRDQGDVEGEEALREAVTKQLRLPRGAVPFAPPGIAPPYFLIVDEVMFIVLPGPPDEASAGLEMVLQTGHVKRWLARGAPLLTKAVHIFGGDETPINAALAEARRRGLLRGLPAAITCFDEGGHQTTVQMRIRCSQEGAWAAFASFLKDGFGDDLFSSDGRSLDELLTPLLVGRRIGVYGWGPATAALYLRLRASATVSMRVFGDPREARRFADARSSGEPLARAIAERGVSRDGNDIAVALVGESPAEVCVANAAGPGVTRSLVAPPDQSGDVSASFEEGRTAYLTYGMLRLLYEAQQPLHG